MPGTILLPDAVERLRPHSRRMAGNWPEYERIYDEGDAASWLGFPEVLFNQGSCGVKAMIAKAGWPCWFITVVSSLHQECAGGNARRGQRDGHGFSLGYANIGGCWGCRLTTEGCRIVSSSRC